MSVLTAEVIAKIPKQYRWLTKEPGPKMLLAALNYFGIAEIVGKQHNPIILGWADELGYEGIFQTDETPWCGLLMAKVAKDADKEIPEAPYRARNWAMFGRAVDKPMLGDVLVYQRPGGHHVGLYVAHDVQGFYHTLGGNQGNKVGIVRMDKDRCVAIRRPIFKIGQPPNVRPILMTAEGPVSVNER